jgi:hypothetical protein
MAEALVAPMFKGIFKTLTDYCMEEISFKLNNKFVKYNPQEWRDQFDMTINVGIGTGDIQQQNQFLMQMAQAQATVAQSPLMGTLLTPKNIYNLQAKLAENAGFKNPGEYWTDPETVQPPEPQEPQPSPDAMIMQQTEIEKAKIKAETDLQIAQMKIQAEMQLKREEMQLEHSKHIDDTLLKQQEIDNKANQPVQPFQAI